MTATPDARATSAPPRAREGGARFQYPSVVERYRHRPPYSREVFDVLLGLIGDAPRRVLDAGCGPGKLARELAPLVDQVDAVDWSDAMLQAGRSLAGADHPHLRWILAAIETAPLAGPYGLVCCGASFHWMDADVVLPRFGSLLAPGALLAVIDGDAPVDAPWEQAEFRLYGRYAERLTGVLPDWGREGRKPVPLGAAHIRHPNFERIGSRVTQPAPFEQSIEHYVSCQHSRQSWCLEAMGTELAADFDRELTALLSDYANEGQLRFEHATAIEWGRPVI